jgi:ribonucleoside-triphosphate reductase (thioredoxin)
MSKSLPTQFQSYIHLSRYSRWVPEKSRRETWEETVERYFAFFEQHLKTHYKYELSTRLRNRLQSAILSLQVMPSMRALMTAGEALERENIAGYNCSYIPIDSPRAFDEILYILMNGTGVGFSVERQHISKLPQVADELFDSDTVIVVRDSKLGWAKALKELITMLFVGQIPKWDTSKVRPAGSPLKTFGGRASGPEPLIQLFNFVVRIFKDAAGRKLTSLECHDIVCKIADVVVVGGVRRSALISLSNLSDDRMRAAKSGQWWLDAGQRALANNSACYTERPDIGIFMKEWLSLYESKSGERGIFNRIAASNQCKKYGRREPNHDFGTNPCSEIILRGREFCNLSEVVIRHDDTEESLKEKIELATILGTFQSTLTNFNYISKDWKKNCEEERLLGVSLTGIMDSPLLNNSRDPNLPGLLERLREHSVKVNAKLAKELGINPSVAITCVKPSGTVSQLVDSASGIHTRHSEYYIRTIRADKKDPLCQLMKDMGFPWEACVMKPDTTVVFSFPVKAPDGATVRKDMSAIQQLDMWLVYQRHWCEHKPSVTITVKESEWVEVGAYVWKHFDEMSGVSFLPYSDHVYQQAPYQECTKEQFLEMTAKIPKDADWSKLSEYEKKDHTSGTQELACTGNSCEIVDI